MLEMTLKELTNKNTKIQHYKETMLNMFPKLQMI